MRNFFHLLAAIIILISVSSCQGDYRNLVGTDYYTKFSLQYEKEQYLTTNYRRGILLPVNSRVMIKKMNNKAILVEIKQSGQKLSIINVPKHTNENINQVFDKIFSKTPIDLSNFSELEKRNIAEGKVENGMRKEAVIVAIGYPPYIKTPTLESNEWIYWSSKFNKFSVSFENNKVSNIKN